MLAQRRVNKSTFRVLAAAARPASGFAYCYSAPMRIERPTEGWAAAHRAQEDAHTLTVAEVRPPVLVAPGHPEDELLTIRVSVPAPANTTVTLTF